MPPKLLFKIGDVLVARDQKKNYPCKVINVDKESRTPKYFVHYNGWNRRWDKWVDESTLSKKEFKAAKAAEPVLEGAKDDADAELDAPFLSNKEIDKAIKKRKRDLLMDNLLEEDDVDTQGVKMQIPFHLQKHLVQEWEVITHEPRHLIALPRPIPVAQLLQEFLELKKAKTDAEQYSNYADLVKELVVYFNDALPVLLLYRQELDQFRSALGGKKPSDVYGAEHLLRLFVRMPRLLLQTSISGSDYNQILNRLCEIIKFIHKNSERLIGKGQYVPVSSNSIATEPAVPSSESPSSVSPPSLHK